MHAHSFGRCLADEHVRTDPFCPACCTCCDAVPRVLLTRYSLLPCMLRPMLPGMLPACYAADRGQVAQQWNEVRREIIRSAVKDQLVPAFRAHFQAKLLQDAREAAARK
jgi:hypothetical protein